MPTLVNVIVRKKGALTPIPNATVIWWDQGGRSDARITDGNGFVNFGTFVSGGLTVGVIAPAGYANFSTYKTTDDPTFILELEPSATPFDVAESGFIRRNGIDFVRADGRTWYMAALTAHTLIANVARGDTLGWFFDLMDRYGANTALVIGTHLSQWKIDNGVAYDPRRSDHLMILSRLFDLAAARQKRVFFQALADCQNVGLSDQQYIWSLAYAAARGRWNVFLGKGNEYFVNGWFPGDLANPTDTGGVLVCQGTTGATPYAPHLDFAGWETRTAPVHKLMDDAGAGVLEMQAGYTGFPAYAGPIVVVETKIYYSTNPDPFGDFRGTSPAEARQIGLNAGANAQGLGLGTTNLLIGRPPDAIEDACMLAGFRGFWAAASQR